MLKRWAAWPPGIRWLVGTAALVLAAAIVWALFVPLADWLAHHDVGSATGALHETALDNARGRLLTLGAGLVAGGALVFTALNFNLLRRNSEQADQWQRRTHELTEQGQITDRYTKAVEQLGSDKLDVRIGGIYALERIARDSATDHPTVMEVLTAFIREHSRERWPPSDADRPEPERLTRPDVQAAVTVIGRRDSKRDIGIISLAGADLTHADLTRAHLAFADLTGAHLDHALLARADLTRALLTRADLTRANLTLANLTEADLIDADLTGADLTAATLTAAHLTGAVLTGAVLTGAVLTGAHLDHANLTRANLTLAVLTGAALGDTDLTGAHLTGAVLTGATLTGAVLTGAALGDTDLTGADLTGARWPEGVQAPGGWITDNDSGRLAPWEPVIRGNGPLPLITRRAPP
jgi:uncharacterized protein YjbI with pentapeptide repeats